MIIDAKDTNTHVYMQTKRNETLPFDFRCVNLLHFI